MAWRQGANAFCRGKAAPKNTTDLCHPATVAEGQGGAARDKAPVPRLRADNHRTGRGCGRGGPKTSSNRTHPGRFRDVRDTGVE